METEKPKIYGLTDSEFESEILNNRKSSDVELVAIVRAANSNPGLKIGVTLTVGGILVSGSLVGVNEFLAARDASARWPEPESVSEGYVSIRDFFYPNRQSKELPVADVPSNVHLIDATIHTAMRSYKVGAWRGKISVIDGYSLGIVTIDGE